MGHDTVRWRITSLLAAHYALQIMPRRRQAYQNRMEEVPLFQARRDGSKRVEVGCGLLKRARPPELLERLPRRHLDSARGAGDDGRRDTHRLRLGPQDRVG